VLTTNTNEERRKRSMYEEASPPSFVRVNECNVRVLTSYTSYSPPFITESTSTRMWVEGGWLFQLLGLTYCTPPPLLTLKRKIYELTLLDVCLVASLAPWMFYS